MRREAEAVGEMSEDGPVAEPGPLLFTVSLDSDPTIDAYKAGVDRTLLRENLKLTTDQRVAKMISALAFAETVRRSKPVSSDP